MLISAFILRKEILSACNFLSATYWAPKTDFRNIFFDFYFFNFSYSDNPFFISNDKEIAN